MELKGNLKGDPAGVFQNLRIERVAALPGAGDAVDDLVILNTDSHIYRWTGVSWLRLLNLGDLGGLPSAIVGVLPPVGPVGSVIYLTSDSHLYSSNGVAWIQVPTSTDPVAQGGFRLVSDQVLGGAAASVIFAGLDGNVDKGYIIELDAPGVTGGSAGAPYITLNGGHPGIAGQGVKTTGALVTAYSLGGIVYLANGADGLSIGQSFSCQIDLYALAAGAFRRQLNYKSTHGGLSASYFAHAEINNSPNIVSIELTQNTGLWAPGTHARLYKYGN